MYLVHASSVLTAAAAAAAAAADAGPSWTDVASALGSGVAALAAVGTLVVAVVAAVYAKRQVDGARAQLDEARTLRREQAQPYVVVYAQTMDQVSGHLVEIVITNLGTTGARNVTFTCDPPLVRTPIGASQVVALPETMPFLAPRQVWRTFWDGAPERHGSDLPDRFEVTAAYTDTLGQHHREVFILDWRLFYGRMFTTEKTVHHVGQALEDMAQTLGAWAQKDEVLRVATYDGAEHDERLERRAAEVRARHEEAQRRHEDLTRRLLPGRTEEEQP